MRTSDSKREGAHEEKGDSAHRSEDGRKCRGGLAYSGKCYICQSECMDDAKAVAMLVESRFPNLNGKVEIYPIGATIGSHTGPGTVALFFWGKERVD